MSDLGEDYLGSAEEDGSELSDAAFQAEELGDEEQEEENAGGEEEAEEEHVEEEEEEQFPPNPVTSETMRTALSCLARIGHGLAHAYVRADLDNRELTDIQAMTSFIHLRHINMSSNYIRDIGPISSMTHLVTLKVDENLVTSLKTEELPYLQQASFNSNRIKSLDGVTHPMLENLSVSFNLLSRIDFPDPVRLQNLRVLDLRGNKLQTTAWEYPPNVEELYVAANLITSLEGIDRMSNLRVLHLRDNQLQQLDGFSENMQKLQYLNIRGNNIEETDEFKKLSSLPQLRALIVQDNPVSEQDDYRVQIWAAMEVKKSLERIDKDELVEEEVEEAKELLEAEREEGEAAGEKEGTETDGQNTTLSAAATETENTRASFSLNTAVPAT